MKRFLLTSAVCIFAFAPSVFAQGANTITVIHEDGSKDVLELGGKASKKAPEPAERRSIYLDGGRQEIDVYTGAELRPGHRIAGPAIIEELTTTVLIGPADRLEVDAANNFMIHLDEQGA